MSPNVLQQIIQILNDGDYHTSNALAMRLGMDHNAVARAIKNLTDLGIDIRIESERGYQLEQPLELLNQTAIVAALSAAVRSLITAIEIHQIIDSSNTYLMARAKNGLAGGSVCLVEYQSCGRGRRNRSWISPFGANLYLSVLWRFRKPLAQMSGLSLMIGIAVVRALERLGVVDVGLKWPNDLLWRRRKLGGILLELGGGTKESCYGVTGIGLNVMMPASAHADIDQPWIDLRRILEPKPVSRNRLAAYVLDEIMLAFIDFERYGLILRDWRQYDVLADQRVVLQLPNTSVTGTARGVDESGSLLLETAQGMRHFEAGEISLRTSALTSIE